LEGEKKHLSPPPMHVSTRNMKIFLKNRRSTSNVLAAKALAVLGGST
jgi:hypothetical protein